MYLYLFAVHLLAWIFKLSIHPSAIHSIGAVIERARVSVVPGEWIVGLTAVLSSAIIAFAWAYGGVDSAE